MEGIPATDALVGEYLIFRGFRATSKAFHSERDRPTDRLGSAPSADSVVELLLEYVKTQQYAALSDCWRNLDKRFLSSLPAGSPLAVQAPRLELALMRYFLVQAARQQRTAVLTDFFTQHASPLSSRPEWSEWFALPYVAKDVATHPVFAPYCTRQWMEAFTTSLRNFLRSLFQQAPLPQLLQSNQHRLELRSMQSELEALRLETSRSRLHARDLERQLELSQSNLRRALVINESLHTAIGKLTKSLRSTVQSSAAVNEVASLVAQAASQLAPVPSPDPLPDSDTDEPVVAASKDDDPDDAAMHARLSEARAALSNAAEALSAASGEKLSSMSQLGMSALQKHAVDRTAAEVSGRQLDSDHNFKVVELASLAGHTDAVCRARFSTDGELVVSASRDGVVRVFSLAKLPSATDKPRSVLNSPVLGRSPHLTSVGAAAALAARSKRADGGMLRVSEPLSDDESNAVGAVAIESSMQLMHAAPVSVVQWEPRSDRLLLSASTDGQVKLWDVSAGARVVTEFDTDAEFPLIQDMAASPTDALVVIAAGHLSDRDQGNLGTWNLKTGRVVNVLRTDPERQCVNSVAFNHNGNMLATGGADGMIRVFDMIGGAAIMGWPAHQGAVTSVHFSSDETCLISCGVDGAVVEWSLHRARQASRAFAPPMDRRVPRPMTSTKLAAALMGHTDIKSVGGMRPLLSSQHMAACLPFELAFDGVGKHFLLSSVLPDRDGAFLFHVDEAYPLQTLGRGTVNTVDWHPVTNMCLTGGGSAGREGSLVVQSLTRRTHSIDHFQSF